MLQMKVKWNEMLALKLTHWVAWLVNCRFISPACRSWRFLKILRGLPRGVSSNQEMLQAQWHSVAHILLDDFQIAADLETGSVRRETNRTRTLEVHLWVWGRRGEWWNTGFEKTALPGKSCFIGLRSSQINMASQGDWSPAIPHQCGGVGSVEGQLLCSFNIWSCLATQALLCSRGCLELSISQCRWQETADFFFSIQRQSACYGLEVF